MRRDPNQSDLDAMVALLEASPDPKYRALLLEDIHWSSRFLDAEARDRVILRAAVMGLPPYAREELDSGKLFSTQGRTDRRVADVIVVTVKQPELIAALACFGLDINSEPAIVKQQMRFWECDLPCDRRDGAARVVITKADSSQNYPMASFCRTIFSLYSVRMATLVGMAAGVAGETKVCDVVAAESIIDYTHGVQAADGFRARPKSFELAPEIARALSYFHPSRYLWLDEVGAKVEELVGDPRIDRKWLPAEGAAIPEPAYRTGVVLAGDLLIENGSLPDWVPHVHDRAYAVEMEGAGFARACVDDDVPWLVFRGIADYGDVEREKGWQVVSTVAAATALKLLLEKDYFFDGRDPEF